MAGKRKDRKISLSDDSVLHFPLAPLGGFRPERFLEEEKYKAIDALILSLAHAYNDMKSAFLLWEVNREFSAPVPSNKVCKFYGQNVGIAAFCFRVQVGILVELVELIKKNRHLLKEEIWISAFRRINQNSKVSWEKLLSLASESLGEGTFEKELHKFLVKIRSNGGYHYYQTESLAKGFKECFSQTHISTEHAYMCLGSNLETSRFFFADAAAVKISEIWKKDLSRDFDSEFVGYLRASHIAISDIIHEYIRARKLSYKSPLHE